MEDEDGRTPFMRCGFSFYRPSEDLASLKLLVKHGANIYAKSKSGSYKSALVTAIQAENFNVVKYLVDDLGMVKEKKKERNVIFYFNNGIGSNSLIP